MDEQTAPPDPSEPIPNVIQDALNAATAQGHTLSTFDFIAVCAGGVWACSCSDCHGCLFVNYELSGPVVSGNIPSMPCAELRIETWKSPHHCLRCVAQAALSDDALCPACTKRAATLLATVKKGDY